MLAALAVVAGLHQWPLSDWFIEDAAISFVYADNLAHGHGLVAVPGGERVEGYSNFLWVLLLAGFEVVGVSSFSAAKGCTLALTIGSLPLSLYIANDALRKRNSSMALLAPVFLATNAQMAIWSASGLENALFVFLLMAAIARTLHERRVEVWPWSAALFFGLWLTRPEGILYAALGGFWTLVFALADKRGLGIVGRWLITFFGPAAVYHTLRYRYFAWVFPNTYYAKLGAADHQLSDFTARGWRQLAAWADASMNRPLLPAYLVGAVGRFDGWQARYMVTSMAVASLFFSVYADGDWMRGFRWMSLCAGTMSVLLAIGVADIASWVEGQLGDHDRTRIGTASWVTASLALSITVPVHISTTMSFSDFPEDGPATIKRRVDHTNGISDAWFLAMSPEDRIVNLDMDMGAHLTWSTHDIIDLAGLTNVPIAHHDFTQYPFWREYIYEENPPTFTHLHRHWANLSRLREYDGWTNNYFELPPYHDAGIDHGGTFIHRSALMVPRPTDKPLFITDEGLTLHRLTVFSDVMVDEGAVLVQVVVSGATDQTLDLEIRGAGGRRERHRLHLGHELIGTRWWGKNEAFSGRYLLDIGRLAIGPNALDVIVRSPRGTTEITVGQIDGIGKTEVARHQENAVEQALEAANAGDCDTALDRTIAAWALTADRPLVRQQMEDRVASTLASCRVRQSEQHTDPVPFLERARRWDIYNADLLRVGSPIADERMMTARRALDAGDAELAYQLYTDVLRIDPSRAWARRYAEAARDLRLGLNQESP